MEHTQQTLNAITQEHILKSPEHVKMAIEEYLDTIKEKENQESYSLLVNKLKDKTYYNQFAIALSHTSFILFLAALSITQSEVEVNLNSYENEFLHYSKNDDADIQKMKIFYLTNITAEDLGITGTTEDYADISESLKNGLGVDANLTTQNIEKMKKAFENTIKSLIATYRQMF